MATHKSALKRNRQGECHRERNAAVKSSIRTAVKTVIAAVDGKDTAAAKTALAKTAPAIAKAAAKGAMHKKTASRKISRLTKKVNALQA